VEKENRGALIKKGKRREWRGERDINKEVGGPFFD